MKDLLKQLYPNDLDFVLEQVSCLKRKYNPDNSKDLSKLTHQDCILITYGDAIFEPSRTPLSSLKRFADEYLKEGISAIHLLPCFPYTSDDGFSVVDYYEINSELGSWKDIDELKITFDIMFDAVVNHMSKKSSWFQAFLKGTETFDTYFIEADPNADYSDVVRPRALPLLHKFDKQGKEVYVWTTFSEDQVDLNYRSAKVFIQVLDVLLFYIHKGARYIRLDAIAFLWKTMGTSCIHLKETHLVIQAYRQVFNEIAPHAIIITETNVPHVENVSYFGNGSNEAHMVYNFTLPPLLAHSIHEQEISTLTKWAKSLSLPGSETCFFNFTASHDGVGVRPLQGIIADEEITRLAEKAELHGGFVSYKDNGDGTKSPYELNCNYMDLITHPSSENTIRAQRFLLTQSVMLVMPGVPGIYYHSILGSENNREEAVRSGINRRINRQKLPYDDIVHQLGKTDSLRNIVYRSYMELLKIRKQEKLFSPFSQASYTEEKSVFIIERKDTGQRLFAIHNFSNNGVKIKSRCPVALDLRTGEEMSDVYWTLQAFEFKWLKESI